MLDGFKKFLLRGNVVDLAVAVVIGAAFKEIVDTMVKGLITPLLGVFGGVPDFSALSFSINNSRFLIGEFINAIVAFVILAAVIYFIVVVPMNRVMARMMPKEPEPQKTRECPYCLSKIPVLATRCAFCTAEVAAA
ncbi:MAG: large conductance mechanosensitive channel protein MscL [Chloroflexi bacterium]|nr:large conductance mechanosensitive channel protein MscL [Chloroflexota bacterium]